jgi:hypothetical protein
LPASAASAAATLSAGAMIAFLDPQIASTGARTMRQAEYTSDTNMSDPVRFGLARRQLSYADFRRPTVPERPRPAGQRRTFFRRTAEPKTSPSGRPIGGSALLAAQRHGTVLRSEARGKSS